MILQTGIIEYKMFEISEQVKNIFTTNMKDWRQELSIGGQILHEVHNNRKRSR